MRTPTADVEATVLTWARTSSGLSEEEAARRAKLHVGQILAWEAGVEQPSVAQLRKLAEVYRRPLAVLFLSRAPRDFDVMRDFRRLPGGTPREWSLELHAEYRRALDQRERLLELAELEGEGVPQLWRLAEPLPETAEGIGALLRGQLVEALGFSPPSRGDQYDHLNYWASALEEAGVLVLSSSGVEVSEMRGFSLYFDDTPVVVTNGSDFPRGRLFTLLHEAAHLVLGTAGLCDVIVGTAAPTENLQLEARCNAISAAALMPRSAVLSLPVVAGARSGSETWTEEQLRDGAAVFGVSTEAFLRRLLTLGYTTDAFYRQRRERLLEIYAEEERRRRTDGKGNFYRTAARDLGKGFVRRVTSAERRRVIDTYTAATFLDVKVGQITPLAEAARIASA